MENIILNHKVEIMHSSRAVDSLIQTLNSIPGVKAKLEKEPPFKRNLVIEINKVDPTNGKEITNDEILSLGAMIGAHLVADLK